MLSRRRIVLYVSLGLLLTLVAGVATGVLLLTRSGWGQDKVRVAVQNYLASRVHGHVYVGRITGNYLTSVTVDSFEIRDAEDSLFVATGPVTVDYDPRDIMDKRLLFSRVTIHHPTVYLRQHENYDWNFRRIFRSGRRGTKATGPQYGDYVVADSVRLRNATFELTKPWHADDSLHGARRDSAIAAALHNPEVEIRRRREGLAQTWRWTDIDAVLPHVRLNDPDSVGRTFAIDSLNLEEDDPPVRFRNLAGTVRSLGDSIWIDVSDFVLPGSRGSGRGKIWWGSDLPIRYNLHVIGDTVALADIHWIYPTLPMTGGGSTVLDIRNERNLHVLDYRLTKMDVRTSRSRLRGAMTFAVGGPVLQVRDVDLQAEPVNFDLLRTLNGKPFPVDWQGEIRGMVTAKGGPLTHFVVDTAVLSFADAHVPGAVSALSGSGELDILNPGLAQFHQFNLDAQTVDLRSIEFLYPEFPRLHGWISGTATLDSSWMDVRFADADVHYHDSGMPTSRITGSGRLTFGDQFTTYDASLFADSLSLSALRLSYPGLPVVGTYAGPIRVQGTTQNLLLDASLRGPNGAMSFNGHLDTDPPTYGVHGSGRVVGVDPALALAGDSLPSGSITGDYDLDLIGDSLADLRGSARLSLERSELDHVSLFTSLAHLRFDGGRVHVDSTRVETSAATLTASGALGLHPGVVDSMSYHLSVDSLGGLRPFLQTRVAAQSGKPDSLAGSFYVDGQLTGNLDSLDVSGHLRGTSLYINKDRGASTEGEFAFANVLHAPRGTGWLRLDTLVIGGVRVDTIGFSAQLARIQGRGGPGVQFAGTYGVGVLSDNGPTLGVGGTISHVAGRTAMSVDSGALVIGDETWKLAAPGTIDIGPSLIRTDTLRMRNGAGGVVSAAAYVPLKDTVTAWFRADSIPVRDAATLLQVADTMSGWGSMRANVMGTRDAPRATVDIAAHDLRYGGMELQRVDLQGAYADRRTVASFDVYRDGVPTLSASASLPMELRLFSARLLDDSLSGAIRADSADFAIIEAFLPTVSEARGRMFLALDVGGTWGHPTLGGVAQMNGGELTIPNLGITLHDLTADLFVSNRRDSLAVRRLHAWSGASPANNVSVGGFVDFADRSNPRFRLSLTAHDFRVVDKHSLARLDVSTARNDTIKLVGRQAADTLTGSVNIVRGTIYLPERELAKKQMVQLSYADLEGLIDTTDLGSHIKLPSPPSAFLKDMTIRGVRVTLGDEVWLRSQEANIKLGGALNVRTTTQRASAVAAAFSTKPSTQEEPKYSLALDGTLTAERGTYTLSLGILQREFQVEGGTITFYGRPDPNPKIDVTALYTVRQYNRPDVTVRARLAGYLYPGPSLDLESGESYAIPQSDLVSYLCCGVPSFELGANQSYLRTAAQVLLPTASSVLAHTLRGQLGSTFDILQFQPGATEETTTRGAPAANTRWEFLSGARLGGEKQLTNNVFFSISTGFCQFNPNQSGTGSGVNAFVEQLESKLQYRFSSTLSAELGLEPPSSALLCGRTQRGLVPTPQQWGLSLSKTWRW